MPRIISYTPPWLSRPEPASQLFASSKAILSSPHREARGSGQGSNKNANGTNKQYLGPKRTIAKRGTEIVVAVDNEIRWSDLCMLKDKYDDAEQKRKQKGRRREEDDGTEGDSSGAKSYDNYRVLPYSTSEQIRQLSISPNGDLLAIVTSHTVHVAALPSSSNLRHASNNDLKFRPKMVAPTTHVLAHSPIASVLWHPCGVEGTCLVTITADAVVRLWELNFNDTMSFETPSLAIDLKKLAVGISVEQDFTPSRINTNRGFSLDSVGMDVASACFGGRGTSDESPWCAMTLWIAMKEGDVYALCPLLPTRWQSSSTTLPFLSTQAISNQASMHEGALDSEEWHRCNDQYQWIADLDAQEPYTAHGSHELLPGPEVYCRPSKPGSAPKLQGPFQVFGDDDDDDPEITDIHVIASKIDVEELMRGEDTDTDSGLGLDDDNGLSASVICLLSKTGRVYISLDIDGVQAQWLPMKRQISFSYADGPSLVLSEILDTLDPKYMRATEWPTFSPDVNSRYSFFVTHNQGIYYFSLESWINTLQSELQNTASVGTAFRMEIITNGPGSLREQLLEFQNDQETHHRSPTAAVVLQNSNIGYLLLTAVNGAPNAVLLDKPDVAIEDDLRIETTYHPPQENGLDTVGLPRQPYIPPASLWAKSALPHFVENHVQNRHKKAVREEIRLSSVTLDLMTQAHRVLSEETHTLGTAAADLFRRCERLVDELRGQIERLKKTAQKTEEFLNDRGNEAGGDERPNKSVEGRIRDVQARQGRINDRFDTLSRNMRKLNCKPLSKQERAFAAEAAKCNSSVLKPDDEKHEAEEEQEAEEGQEAEKEQDSDEQHGIKIWYRYDEAKRLAADMIAQVKDISDGAQTNEEESFKIPPDLRKSKVDQVMAMLARESALVDAAQRRLERLSIATFS